MSAVRFTHVGGPTTLIEFAGWRILTDPTFDLPGRMCKFGLGTRSLKVAGPAIPLKDLGSIDAVLLSHDHYADNLDVAGRGVLSSVPVVVTTASGATRLGGTARGLLPCQQTTLTRDGLPTIQITAMPCRHGPPASRFLVGDVIGFSMKWDGQEHGELWISGNTVLYGGVRQVAERLQVGTALMHLGGVRFPISRPLRYTITTKDAVTLTALVQPHTMIPVHYEGWSHFQQITESIKRDFAKAPESVRQRIRWIDWGFPTEIVV